MKKEREIGHSGGHACGVNGQILLKSATSAVPFDGAPGIDADLRFAASQTIKHLQELRQSTRDTETAIRELASRCRVLQQHCGNNAAPRHVRWQDMRMLRSHSHAHGLFRVARELRNALLLDARRQCHGNNWIVSSLAYHAKFIQMYAHGRSRHSEGKGVAKGKIFRLSL